MRERDREKSYFWLNYRKKIETDLKSTCPKKKKKLD